MANDMNQTSDKKYYASRQTSPLSGALVDHCGPVGAPDKPLRHLPPNPHDQNSNKYYANPKTAPAAGPLPPPPVPVGTSYDGDFADVAKPLIVHNPAEAAKVRDRVIALFAGGAGLVYVQCVDAPAEAAVRTLLDLAAAREQITQKQYRENLRFARVSAEPPVDPATLPEVAVDDDDGAGIAEEIKGFAAGEKPRPARGPLDDEEG